MSKRTSPVVDLTGESPQHSPKTPTHVRSQPKHPTVISISFSSSSLSGDSLDSPEPRSPDLNKPTMADRQAAVDDIKRLLRELQTDISGTRAELVELLSDELDHQLWIVYTENLKEQLQADGSTGVLKIVNDLMRAQEQIIQWEQKVQKKATLRAEKAEENLRTVTLANEELLERIAELESHNESLQQQSNTPSSQLAVGSQNQNSGNQDCEKRYQKLQEKIDELNDQLAATRNQDSDEDNEDCEGRCKRLQQALDQAKQEAEKRQNETETALRLANERIMRLRGSPPSRQSLLTPSQNCAQNAIQATSKNSGVGLNDEEIGIMLESIERSTTNVDLLLKINEQVQGNIEDCYTSNQSPEIGRTLPVSSSSHNAVPLRGIGNSLSQNANGNSANNDALYKQYLLGLDYLRAVTPFATTQDVQARATGTAEQKEYWAGMVSMLDNVRRHMTRRMNENYISFAEYTLFVRNNFIAASRERDALRREANDLRAELAHLEEQNSGFGGVLRIGTKGENNTDTGINSGRGTVSNQPNSEEEARSRIESRMSILEEKQTAYMLKNEGRLSTEIEEELSILESALNLKTPEVQESGALRIIGVLAINHARAQTLTEEQGEIINSLLAQLTGPENDTRETLNDLVKRAVERRLAEATHEQDHERVELWTRVDQYLENSKDIFEAIQEFSEDLSAERNASERGLAQIGSLLIQLEDAKRQLETAKTDGVDASNLQAESLKVIRRKLQQYPSGPYHEYYEYLEEQIRQGLENIVELLHKRAIELEDFEAQIEPLQEKIRALQNQKSETSDKSTINEATRAEINDLKSRLVDDTDIAEAAQADANATIEQLHQIIEIASLRYEQETRKLKDRIAQLEQTTGSPDGKAIGLIKVLQDKIDQLEKEAETTQRKHENQIRNIESQNKNLAKEAQKAKELTDESAVIARVRQELTDLDQSTKKTMAGLHDVIAELRCQNAARDENMPAGQKPLEETMQSSFLAYLQQQIDTFEEMEESCQADNPENAHAFENTGLLAFCRVTRSVMLDGVNGSPVNVLTYLRHQAINLKKLETTLAARKRHETAAEIGNQKEIFQGQCLRYFEAALKETQDLADQFKRDNPGIENGDLICRKYICERGAEFFAEEQSELADTIAILLEEAATTSQEEIKDAKAKDSAIIADLEQQITDLEQKITYHEATIRNLQKSHATGQSGGSTQDPSDDGISDADEAQRNIEILHKQIERLNKTNAELKDSLTNLQEERLIQTPPTDYGETITELNNRIAALKEQLEQALDATYEVEAKLTTSEAKHKNADIEESDPMDEDDPESDNLGPSVSSPLRPVIRSLQHENRRLEDRVDQIKTQRDERDGKLCDTISKLKAKMMELRKDTMEETEALAGLREDSADLEAEVGMLEEQNKGFEKQLDDLISHPEGSDIKRLREVNVILAAEIEELRVNPQEDENEDLQDRIQELEDQLKIVQEKYRNVHETLSGGVTIAELREALKEERKTVRDLLDECESLEEERDDVMKQLKDLQEEYDKYKEDHIETPQQTELLRLREQVKNQTPADPTQLGTPPPTNKESQQRKRIIELEARLKKRDEKIATLKETDGGHLRSREDDLPNKESNLKDLIRKQDKEAQELKERLRKKETDIQDLKDKITEHEEIAAMFAENLDNGQEKETELEQNRSKSKELQAKRQAQQDQLGNQGGRSGRIVTGDDSFIFGQDEPIAGIEGPADQNETEEERNLRETYIQSLETTINDMKHEERRLQDRIQQLNIEIQALSAGGDEGLLAQIEALKKRISDLEKQLDECRSESWEARRKRVQAAYKKKRDARKSIPRLEACLVQQRHWQDGSWGGERFLLPKSKTRMVSRGLSEGVSASSSARASSEALDIDLAGITREDKNPDTPPSIRKRENTPILTSRKRSREKRTTRGFHRSSDAEPTSESESPPFDDDTPSRPPPKKAGEKERNPTAFSPAALKPKRIPRRMVDVMRKRMQLAQPRPQEQPEPEEVFPEIQRPPPPPRSPAVRPTRSYQREAAQQEQRVEEAEDPRPTKKSRRTPEPPPDDSD